MGALYGGNFTVLNRAIPARTGMQLDVKSRRGIGIKRIPLNFEKFVLA